jgi:F0F1-type ATP synthase assembly protein I
MRTASDEHTVTSVTWAVPRHSSFPAALSELEKNFTSSKFDPRREGPLTTPGSERPKDPQAEFDRLMHNKPKGPDGRKAISGSEFAGIGIQFAVVIVLFALSGIWLDRKLGTSPILVIVLVLGGSGLGFWSMVKQVNARSKR